MTHLCIAPACPGDCMGCSHAIGSETVMEYARRYAWLRQNFGSIVVHANGGFPNRTVLRIESIPGFTPVDATSVDAAFDAAMLPAA